MFAYKFSPIIFLNKITVALGFLVSVLWLVMATGAHPQEPSRHPVPTPPAGAEQIEVRLGQVEVFVYDKENRFVSGLGPGDFILKVDGKPVQVRYVDLMEIAPQVPNLGQRPKTVQGEVVRPYQQAGATPPSLPFNTLIILYDQAHTGGLIMQSVRPKLYQHLRNLAEDRTYFMVVRMDPNGGFRIEHGLSTDVEATLESLDKLQVGSRGGSWVADRIQMLDTNVHVQADRCNVYEDPQYRSDCLERAFGSSFLQARNLGMEERKIARNVAQSFQTMFEFLAHVPGRKSVLFISEGFDPTGLYYTSHLAQLVRWYVERWDIPSNVETRILQEFRSELSSQTSEAYIYEDIVRQANASAITMYWLNPATPDAAIGADTDIRPTLSNEFNVIDMEFQMGGLAENTGGIAWNAPSGFEKLFDQIAQDFRHYYLVSFEVGTLPEDIRHHKLEVKVNRPGVKTRVRSSYAEIPWNLRISRQLAAGLDFSDMYPGKELRAQFRPVWRTVDYPDLHIAVAIPIKDLVPLITTADVFYDEVHVAWVIRDPEGKVRDKGYERLPIQIPSGSVEQLVQNGALLQYAKFLDVKGKDSRVALAVLETGGWKTYAFQWSPPKIQGQNCPIIGGLLLGSEMQKLSDKIDGMQWTPEGNIRYKEYLVKFGVQRLFRSQGQLVGFYQILLPSRQNANASANIRFSLYREEGSLVNQVNPTAMSFKDIPNNVKTSFFILPYHGLIPGGYELEVELETSDPPCLSRQRSAFKVMNPPTPMPKGN